MFGENLLHCASVAYVTLLERIVPRSCNRRKRIQISCIRETVDVDDALRASLDQKAHDGGSNEASAASDKTFHGQNTPRFQAVRTVITASEL
jgi:hypothetical protein